MSGTSTKADTHDDKAPHSNFKVHRDVIELNFGLGCLQEQSDVAKFEIEGPFTVVCIVSDDCLLGSEATFDASFDQHHVWRVHFVGGIFKRPAFFAPTHLSGVETSGKREYLLRT